MLTGSHKERTRSNRDNLHNERFNLNMGSEHFTVRTINQGNNLPRDVAGFISLVVFKM